MYLCNQDIFCQYAGNGVTEMDNMRQSAQLCASITLTTLFQSSLLVSLSHTFYLCCMIGACGLATAGTCSVNECGLTDGGSWRLWDNSATGIDGRCSIWTGLIKWRHWWREGYGWWVCTTQCFNLSVWPSVGFISSWWYMTCHSQAV